MGMAYNKISVDHIVPPVCSMLAQGLLDEPVFAFRLDASEGDGGECTFGGVDENAFGQDLVRPDETEGVLGGGAEEILIW